VALLKVAVIYTSKAILVKRKIPFGIELPLRAFSAKYGEI